MTEKLLELSLPYIDDKLYLLVKDKGYRHKRKPIVATSLIGKVDIKINLKPTYQEISEWLRTRYKTYGFIITISNSVFDDSMYFYKIVEMPMTDYSAEWNKYSIPGYYSAWRAAIIRILDPNNDYKFF